MKTAGPQGPRPSIQDSVSRRRSWTPRARMPMSSARDSEQDQYELELLHFTPGEAGKCRRTRRRPFSPVLSVSVMMAKAGQLRRLLAV